MAYVDGFVLVVPKKKARAYKKLAQLAGKIWRKHGALDYKECRAEDIHVRAHEGMKPRAFPEMAKAKKGEDVWFSFIVFKSRKHRDQVNAKVMKDPAMNDPRLAQMPMPFDMKRMAYGGFTVIVDA